MTSQPTVGQLVRAPKTAELIARQVRGQIVRGELAAGDALPTETDLMLQFGVSRPTLREAFRILESESLLVIRRGARGGPRVITPDISVAARHVGLLLQLQGTTVRDIYEASAVLEPACARLFAQKRSKDRLDELRTAVDELRDACADGTGDGVRIAQLIARVHDVVRRGSGNRTLAVQGGVVADVIATHTATTVDRDGDEARQERYRKLIRSCDKLIGYVERGEADAAEQHWRRHVDAVAQSLLAQSGPKSVIDLFS